MVCFDPQRGQLLTGPAATALEDSLTACSLRMEDVDGRVLAGLDDIFRSRGLRLNNRVESDRPPGSERVTTITPLDYFTGGQNSMYAVTDFATSAPLTTSTSSRSPA